MCHLSTFIMVDALRLVGGGVEARRTLTLPVSRPVEASPAPANSLRRSLLYQLGGRCLVIIIIIEKKKN